MDYKLCKSLKDAGFPQKTGGVYFHEGGYSTKPKISVPTLEELIEACGVGVSLFQHGNKWFSSLEPQGTAAEGSTPTEAVANLWLALNTSKKQ